MTPPFVSSRIIIRKPDSLLTSSVARPTLGHKLSQPATSVLGSVDATASVVPRRPMTTSSATTILAPPTPSLIDHVLPQLDLSIPQLLPSVSSSTKLIPSLSPSSQRRAPAAAPSFSTLPGSATTALGNILCLRALTSLYACSPSFFRFILFFYTFDILLNTLAYTYVYIYLLIYVPSYFILFLLSLNPILCFM